MHIPLIIVALHIAGLFLISYYAKKRAQGGSANYILAGRQLPTPLIAVSIIGLAIGGASTIGVSEQAYQVGLSAGWYTVAWGIGAMVMGLVMAPKYRELNITTIPELYGKYYDNKSAVAGVACQILIQLVITSLQYLAGGSILHALLPDVFSFQTGMITSAVVFISITFIGGMWSSSMSNILNILLIYFGIAAATLTYVISLGGVSEIARHLPDSSKYFDWVKGVGWTGIGSWIVVMVTVNLSLQSIVQISLSAKNVKAARNGFLMGGLLMIPVGFLAALLGIIAKSAYPNTTAALALPQAIMSLHPALAGVTLAALWAADVSTACNLLLSAATLFSQDIYRKYINPHASEQNFLMITKSAVLALGLVTFLVAFTVSGIIKTLMIGLSLTTAFSVTILFTLFAPSLCRKSSAFYTILTSLAVLILWQFVPAVRVVPHVIYLEWIACIATFLLVYVLDSSPASTGNGEPAVTKEVL